MEAKLLVVDGSVVTLWAGLRHKEVQLYAEPSDSANG